MVELIATITLVGSLLGIGVIIFRKIPVLAELSEAPTTEISWKGIFLNLKKKIKVLNPFKSFSYEIFLQKILSKIRVLTLKTENKTGNWLQKLRERSLKKKFKEDDNYWEEIKKTTIQKSKKKRISRKRKDQKIKPF